MTAHAPLRIRPSHRRAGFALNALVILLAVVVVGLFAWKAATIYSLIPDNAFNAASVRSSVITKHAGYAAFALALAGGLGAGAYFAFKKSDFAANVGMGLPLLAIAVLLTWQRINYMTGVTGTQPASSSATGPYMAAAPPATPRPTLPPRPITPPAPFTPPRGADTPTRPSAGAPTDPAPVPLLQPPPPPPAGPADKPWNPNPAKRSPADVAASLADEDHPARVALDALAADLQPPIDDVLALGVHLDDLIKRPIPSTKPALMDRVKPADELIVHAKALSARLRDLMAEASTRLGQAGQDPHTCAVLSARFARGIDPFERAVACDTIARAAEAAAEFFRLLHDNTGKWTVNAQGDVTVKDQGLKSKLFFARSSYDHQKDRLADALRDLAAGQPLPDPKAKPK